VWRLYQFFDLLTGFKITLLVGVEKGHRNTVLVGFGDRKSRFWWVFGFRKVGFGGFLGLRNLFLGSEILKRLDPRVKGLRMRRSL
jgi:hypothetical protein